MALKQRRGSIAYRFSVKAPLADGLNELSTNINEKTRNDSRARDDLSPITSRSDVNFTTNEKQIKHKEQNHNYIDDKESPRTNGVIEKGSLKNVKNSTTCTVQ